MPLPYRHLTKKNSQIMIAKITSFIKRSKNIHSLASNVVSAGINLISFLLLVRFLTLEQYGQWVIFLTAFTLVEMLRFGLTGTATIRMISNGEAGAAEEINKASYHINIGFWLGVSLLVYAFYFVFADSESFHYYKPFFLYYPILALVALPYNQALTYAQGLVDFKRVLVLKCVNGLSSLLAIIIYISISEITFSGLVLCYILSNLLTSIVALLYKWDGALWGLKHPVSYYKEIFQFGKYSTASYIGSNLLRSSDTFILSFSAGLGAEAIAIYAIPLKLVEFVEIPLRGFTAAALPKFVGALKKGVDVFYSRLILYVFGTMALLLPVVIVVFLFPVFWLQLLGGDAYADSLSLQIEIVYVIAIYMLILPLDRYSGVALFGVNRPDINFYKIIVMLIANVICDIIAVFVFKSLLLVAVATLIFTVAGVLVGWIFLRKNLPVSSKQLLLYINQTRHTLKESFL